MWSHLQLLGRCIFCGGTQLKALYTLLLRAVVFLGSQNRQREAAALRQRDSGLGNECSYQFCWMSILEASAYKTFSNRVKQELWSQSPWVCILDLPLSRCCVTLGKSLLLSVSLFTHLQNRDDDSASYLVGNVRLYKCLLLFPESCGDCYWGKFLSSCHVPRSRVITGTHQNWKQFYRLSTP